MSILLPATHSVVHRPLLLLQPLASRTVVPNRCSPLGYDQISRLTRKIHLPIGVSLREGGMSKAIRTFGLAARILHLAFDLRTCRW